MRTEKRIFTVMIMFYLIASFCACGKVKEAENQFVQNSEEASGQTSSMESLPEADASSEEPPSDESSEIVAPQTPAEEPEKQPEDADWDKYAGEYKSFATTYEGYTIERAADFSESAIGIL